MARFFRKFENLSDENMWSALEVAHQVFHDHWSRASYQERGEILGNAARLMEERVEDLDVMFAG